MSLYVPQIGDILRCTTFVTHQQQTALNVFHFVVQDLGSSLGADLRDWAEAFDAKIRTDYLAAISARATWQGSKCELVTFPKNNEMWGVYSSPTSGSYSGDLLPRQVAGLISWRTSVKGGTGRGRTFMPFPGEGANGLDGQPTFAYKGLLDALANTLINVDWMIGAIAVQAGFAVLSRKEQGVHGIIDHVSKQQWGEQHRRGDFGRANIAPF